MNHLRGPLAVGVLLSCLGMLLSGCASSPTESAAAAGTASTDADKPMLDPASWSKQTYDRLVELVEAEKGTGKYAIFDFDNTTQARDVGIATTGQTQSDGALKPRRIPDGIVPPIVLDGETTTIEDGVLDYFFALSEIGEPINDPYGAYASNTIMAQFWAGKSVQDLLEQVRRAYDDGAGEKDLVTGKFTSVEGVGRPFVYPEMADLYGYLRSNGYNVWVTSAGITWAVRWMVQNVLNPQIVAKYGADAALPLDHVVGVGTLLRDKRTGEIVTDYGLTQGKPNAGYVNLAPNEMKSFEILELPDPLNSWHGGKVGAIQNRITREQPYLAGGDSDGDLEMLNWAQNRLWITRLDVPELQETVNGQFAQDQAGNWLLQPTISSAPVGFLPTKCAMDDKYAQFPNEDTEPDASRSISILEPSGKVASFLEC